MARNAFYAQSGGVTAVINASAAGVIETARKHRKHIGKVYAGKNGILGALYEELIDTSKESPAAIRALKHTPGGGSVTLTASATDNDCVEFTVTDTGPGIQEEFQGRIFDRFFRVPKQEKTGAGLGLSIAREITVAHGGRIGVRSTAGKGCTFFVMLPSV